MSRILGLDVGEKRIGVAVTDALNITAQGIETVRRKDIKDTLNRINALVKEYDISKIVVGIPFNMDGTKSRSAKLIEEFITILKENVPLKIDIIDESLTTIEGENVLLEANVSRKKRKSYIDKIAAQLILQTYLASRVVV